ncbi:MAG: hypothetical protein JXM70_17720 [Pirellulales bacterium]|nr:hypothetical protein [Pirellulales bacterium]
MISAMDIDTQSNESVIVTAHPPWYQQKQRIQTALGVDGNHIPQVNEITLSRYFKYLAENLIFPFTAHYPEPTNLLEEILYECTVVKLLHPSEHAQNEFDGIFCKTWKADHEVDLPLVELEVSQDSPNFQIIEDYWYWLWNWRCR